MTNWTEPQERWFYGTIRSAQHALDIIGRGTTMPAYAFQLARDESERIEQAMALTPSDRGDEATRLLLAAPALYAALQALRNVCSGTPRPDYLLSLLAQADAALACASPVEDTHHE